MTSALNFLANQYRAGGMRGAVAAWVTAIGPAVIVATPVVAAILLARACTPVVRP